MDGKFSEFGEFKKSDWDQFKEPFCYLYLAGAAVACWCCGSMLVRILFFKCTVICLSLISTNSVRTFRENSNVFHR